MWAPTYKSGSSGSATVDAATWTNSGYLYVGGSGSGLLSITNGGIVNGGSGLTGFIASSSTASGTVTVDGASQLNCGSYLHIGDVGAGLLRITNGGTVSNATGAIGYGNSASGTVTVNASTWTNTGDLSIGPGGNGTLNIQNGGYVSAGSGTTCVGFDGLGSSVGGTTVINFSAGGGTLSTKSLYVAPSQLTGTGAITTHGLVGDVNLDL